MCFRQWQKDTGQSDIEKGSDGKTEGTDQEAEGLSEQKEVYDLWWCNVLCKSFQTTCV